MNMVKYFRRFLHDIIIIFKGNNKELHLWLAGLHLNIKYIMSHTSKSKCEVCGDDQTKVPYLDTQVEIKHNKVITDLYKKPTDRNMYLLPSSSHVASVSQNIFLI